MRVLHCITGLSGDGAQRMLLRLASVLRKRGFSQGVINLGSRGPLAEQFESEDIPVLSLAMDAGAVSMLRGLQRLAIHIEKSTPDLLQGWMYHANLMLLGARALARGTAPVLWNIRRGLDDYRELGVMTRLIVRISARLSGRASAIIYCSRESRKQHESYGFDIASGLLIENGFEVERFRPSETLRQIFRREMGFGDEDVVIGVVGRFAIAKGHQYLFEALRDVVQDNPRVKLVCVGRGMCQSNSDLRSLIEANSVAPYVALLGERSDVELLYPGFDVYCSSSIGEGFPNAIAEAMACSVPCVVTDTGASRELVDGIGFVVPTRSVSELSSSMSTMVRKGVEERRQLGAKSRARIRERFSMDAIADRYEAIYSQMCRYF